MTRSVCDLKEANGDIGDHLRNHIHLTNCIHLKNHMHKHSCLLGDRSFSRDLVVIQKSRSLRDPSASPPSRHPPFSVDISKRQGRDAMMVDGRRSVSIEHHRDGRWVLGAGSRLLPSLRRVEGVSSEENGRNEGAGLGRDRSSNGVVREHRRNKREDVFVNSETKDKEIPEASIHVHRSGHNRVKRHKFQGMRRTRTVKPPRDSAEEGKEESDEQNVTRTPGNVCGIHWNWSNIHHRGKSLFDFKSRKCASFARGREIYDTPAMSESLSLSTKSDADAMPLLVDASGSQKSTENAAWAHDYSGELGIFADNLLNQDIDFGNKPKFKGHQNLTQKYTPRTFKDLVGQNLVAQVLSNAVFKRKVGLLYVFYGPHGTGKTSCARIFARALNCQSADQPKPCGLCDSCIAYDMGKSWNIREVGPDFDSIMGLLDNMIVSQLKSQHMVFIFDDCDTLSPGCWSALSKVIDRAPRRVVFVLVSSSLDVFPHVIITRCQKFLFPKLKDANIIYALRWIATKEDIEADEDALKLIASRSDGSLRDAEMTLEQLSLLGQRISVALVQELVGLISDEKLVDLLDLALSADTVNTVKKLREIIESGVEPLALMSQLATVITDLLAGSYDLTKQSSRRKFFRRHTLLKEDMEKLRQALKTLSEAEKQLRMSNDRLTWLTAALLQLAPDQQYMFPSSSVDTSFNYTPLIQSNAGRRERHRKSIVEYAERPNTERRWLMHDTRIENLQGESSFDAYHNAVRKSNTTDGRRHDASVLVPQQPFTTRVHKEIDVIWLEVLQKIQISSMKEFMYREGKLISVRFDTVPAVQLMFSSHLTKSKEEKYRAHILEAFESVLGSPVMLEIRCEFREDAKAGHNMPIVLPVSQDGSTQMRTNARITCDNRLAMTGSKDISRRVPTERNGLTRAQVLPSDSLGMGQSEIVEIASPGQTKSNKHEFNSALYDRRDLDSAWVGEAETSHKKSTRASERRKLDEQNQSQCQSLVKSKASLAHVIQQAEGRSRQNGWSKRKAVSIAEKLEQENLKMEPRSRSLLCWKTSRVTRRKLPRLNIRMRKSKTLLRYVSCGKRHSFKSPR